MAAAELSAGRATGPCRDEPRQGGDAWADEDGEHISVVYEDEQVLAVDLPPAEFVIEQFAGAMRF